MAEEEQHEPLGTRIRKFIAPYREVMAYLRPYRAVFIFGSLCGLGFGLVSGAIPFIINFVGKAVFSPTAAADFASQVDGLGAMSGVVRFLAFDLLHLDEISKPFLVAVACLLIPAVMMTRSVLDFLNNYCSEWTSQRVLIDLRDRVMRSVAAQSLDYFNEARAGNLFQRIINETREVQSVITIINTQLIAQPATLLTGLFVLFKLDWKFTVGALVLLPCCVVPSVYLAKRVRKVTVGQEGESRAIMVILHEMIAGIKVIKAFARTGHELERFHASGQTLFKQVMRTRRLMETTSPLIEFLTAIGVALGLFYVYSVGMSGSTFLALCVGIFLLYQPLKTLSKTHLILTRSHVVVSGVLELISQKPTVADAPNAIALQSARGEIAFENVTFAYREGIPALREFSFRFEQGKHYALVGESGAGKSTVLSLIMRFYDPNQGRITFDGHDLRSLTQDSLRTQIGIVTQDTFLFHDTIGRNIAYGRLGAEPMEIVEAAKRAHADAFIREQKDSYYTVIGDKGCMLSGGQQQRIAIARAVLKNAPVLLLDEATSALDSSSEKHIQAALQSLTHGRTVIAIAHRLSTILNADQILVLDKGQIRETGTHRELLDRSGIYRRLYDLQFESQPASLES